LCRRLRLRPLEQESPFMMGTIEITAGSRIRALAPH
jgi:hypothetical protein